jgi:RecJ-like exonuclease
MSRPRTRLKLHVPVPAVATIQAIAGATGTSLERVAVRLLVDAVERCKGYRECGRCKGRGTIGIRDICPPCGGTGRVS